jgi:tetratricopeptide (TPR) repeat protein
MMNRQASLCEETLVIPTYHVQEDPYPPLFGRSDPWVYPYPRRDDILRPPDMEQRYRAVVLENRYLRLTVLPELGGKLYSAYDKTAQREIFYKPQVIKPALIGLRGAWTCGGIEFNFVKGHHVMTTSPVDYLPRENDDGSVSVTVGHTERRSRARWNVTLTLHPDRAYIQSELKLYNRHRYRLDFYQWSNSAMKAREDVRLIYPTDYMISSGRRLYRFPIQGGADLSRWTTIPVAHDLFSIGSDKDFFGVYYERDDVGMVHYANHYQAPGKKMFTWGTDHAGRIWDQILTDTDTPYLEPQAGCVVDQSTFLFLQPHQTVDWREFWWAVKGMKGFVEVNDEGALNLEALDDERTLLAVNTTGEVTGAELLLIVDGQVRHRQRFDVSPEQPFRDEIALPPRTWQGADVQLILLDAEERELIRHHRPPPNMFAKVELPAPFAPQVDAHSGAEALVIAGDEAEKLRDYSRAEELYARALEVEPGHAGALAHRGALYSAQGLYQQACDDLLAAVCRNPDYGIAHYHLGIVCRELGDAASARDHFWATRLDPAANAQAFYHLGEMALAEGDLDRAADMLLRSLDLNHNHVKGHCMVAAVLRLAGEVGAASEALGYILEELEPTDILAQAERWLLGEDEAEAQEEQRQTLLARIGDDVQVLLELAADYMGVARWQDAVEVLRLWPGVIDGEPAHPMVYYTLAYCLDKLGQQQEAHDHHRLAARMDPAYVFPHRLEELTILNRALAIDPEDGRAWGYLGTLLYALRRKEEARDAWRRSLALEPSAVNYRNLGRSLWQDVGDLEAAREQYTEALALAPQDHRLCADLADILAELGAPLVERVSLLREAPQHGRIQARLAAALVENKAWDEAIDVLEAMHFDPYEGERGTRPAYYEAYLGRGLARYEDGDLEGALRDLQAALEYPFNIGVGKSYYAQDAKAYYWAGVVAEALGDVDDAEEYWRQGAAIRPQPVDDHASPQSGYDPEALTFKSLCLQRLGRADEAAELF